MSVEAASAAPMEVDAQKPKPAAPVKINPFAKRENITMEKPWLEKYRPNVLDDVVGNVETVARLKVLSRHGNLPNLILDGPPGTGKTTSIHCLALALLGDSYKNAVLELNASDDRGIDVVRNKIKGFAKRKVVLPPGRHKIIILDEADSMTPSAQQALRRTMEIHSATTRFALACNISAKIIEPIQSRCAILRYTRLKQQEVLKRVKQVMEFENIINYTEDGLSAILFVAEGDMRTALNALQSTYAGFGRITNESVFKVCDQPHPKIMQTILELCSCHHFRKAYVLMRKTLKEGYSTIDIVQTLFRVLKFLEIDEKKKLQWIRDLGFTHMGIAEGLDSGLQLYGLLARFCSHGRPAR